MRQVVLVILMPVLLSFHLFGQENGNSKRQMELARIDSLVELTHVNLDKVPVDSGAGIIDYHLRLRHGKWKGKFYFEDSLKTTPRLIYFKVTGPEFRTFNYRDSEEMWFHYEDGQIIYARIKLTYDRLLGKDKIKWATIYLKGKSILSHSNPKDKRHDYSFLIQEENYARYKMELKKWY